MQFDVNAQRELTIKEGIIPYTKYEIAIIAVNTQHNQSETAREDVISPESREYCVVCRFNSILITIGGKNALTYL